MAWQVECVLHARRLEIIDDRLLVVAHEMLFTEARRVVDGRLLAEGTVHSRRYASVVFMFLVKGRQKPVLLEGADECRRV